MSCLLSGGFTRKTRGLEEGHFLGELREKHKRNSEHKNEALENYVLWQRTTSEVPDRVQISDTGGI